ncbi:MAG: mechanosensitive ion channel [Acidobacteriaceae bacterium]|nr:mechanosensitive ion channel [Acidobacteriaceae bacterium]MBV8572430.1 mechanosensitive ion channel [Acidobacteriaceae bacterium]
MSVVFTVSSAFQIVGPNHVVQLFGVRLVGVSGDNAKKLVFSIVFVSAVLLLGKLLRWLAQRDAWSHAGKRFAFWAHQGISIVVAIFCVVGLVSIWFDNPANLATGAGLLTAGLAFALQKVVTSFAGYLVILRGKTFEVGDRITMGGIRGDVISLNFLQTVIMEMGQPAEGDSGDPMWVQARQYTGRIVRVTNGVIFDEPVYNYTREFPYIWEEIRVPIPYSADRARAERILLDAAHTHTANIAEMGEEALKALESRYVLKRSELKPTVFWRLTDNWIEMTVRFIVPDSGIRHVKSDMSRDILAGLDAAGIGIASGTYQVVGFPPLQVQLAPEPAKAQGASAS